MNTLKAIFKFMTLQRLDHLERRDLYLRHLYKNINERHTQQYGLFASELAFYTGCTPRESLAMYAEVRPYIEDIKDIKDIARRIEKRSGMIMLDAVMETIEKHNLHHEDGTLEQANAIDRILNTLPKHLHGQYNTNALTNEATLKA